VSNIDIVVIAVETPLIIGLYKDKKLFEKISIDGQTSEVLPIEFQKILEKYRVKRILFANGPGSFMAIKIGYIFLKTLSLTKDIELFGVDAFYFNSNAPIRAINSMCFVKRDDEIKIEKVENFKPSPFYLPDSFEVEKYSKNVEPLYILPAI